MKASDNRFYVKFMQLETGLFFTNCKITFFYPRVTDLSLQKVLTTNNTSYSTKCFDYFANELSKFQTQ